MGRKQVIKKRSQTVIVGDVLYQFESEEIGSYCPEPDFYGQEDVVNIDENDRYCKSVEEIQQQYDGNYVYRAHMYPLQPSPWTNGDVLKFHCHVTYRANYSYGDECVTIDQIKHNSPAIQVYAANQAQKPVGNSRDIEQVLKLSHERLYAFRATIELDPPECMDDYVNGEFEMAKQRSYGTLSMPVHCNYCMSPLPFSSKFFAVDPTEMYEFRSHPCLACRTNARKKRKLAEYQKEITEYEEKIERLQYRMKRLREHDEFECEESDSDTESPFIMCDERR